MELLGLADVQSHCPLFDEEKGIDWFVEEMRPMDAEALHRLWLGCSVQAFLLAQTPLEKGLNGSQLHGSRCFAETGSPFPWSVLKALGAGLWHRERSDVAIRNQEETFGSRS